MPLYAFKALDRGGQTIAGKSAANDLNELAAILDSQQLFLVEAKEDKTDLVALPQAPAPAAASAAVGAPGKAVPLRDVSMFTTEFAIMVRTALPILESLESLEKKQKNRAFRAVLHDVVAGVKKGQPLSQAFIRHDEVFDGIYTSLLAAGETSGKLPLMLDRIAAYLDFQREMRSKVTSALLYPSLVVLTALSVVAFLVLFILPTFAEVFSQFEVQLPLPTRVLLFVSHHFLTWWVYYLVSAGALALFIRSWIKDPAHARTLHSLQLSMPITGVLTRNIVMTRVLRTLGALVAAGIPILKSLELARASAGNKVFEDLLGQVHRSAAMGKGLAAALSGNLYVPETVGNMIATSEKTGTLPEVLGKVADFYESETERALKDVFTILEPIFVLGLGLLIGGIAVAVLLPIFELGGTIQ